MERVIQDGCKLPSGPMLMSPDPLIESAKREVLFRTPEVTNLRYLCNFMKRD